MPHHQTVLARQRRLTQILFFVIVLFAATIVALAWAVLDRSEPWSPLEAYPVQNVVNRTVHPGQDVIVEAVKCNGSDQTVTVEGFSQWQSIDPAGTSVLVGRGTREQPPGCLIRKGIDAYHNPIPDLVVQRAANVCESRGTPSHWIISGRETPFDGKRKGVAQPWRTESIEVACS